MVHFVILTTPTGRPGDMLRTHYYGDREITQDELERKSGGIYMTIAVKDPSIGDWEALEIWRGLMSEWLVSQGFRRVPVNAPEVVVSVDEK